MRRRLHFLTVVELANIPLQAGLWFGLIALPRSAANLVGFGLFALLLIQGAAYWAAKLHQLRGRRRTLPGSGVFGVLRATNVVLLAGGSAFTVHAVVTGHRGLASWPGLAFTLFAVLEHINYFHVQLMHDTSADLRRLRRVGVRSSHLARDLARARPRTSRGR